MRHPSRLFFCVGRHVVDPTKPAEGENVRLFPKFSVESFPPSVVSESEAHGHIREVKPGKLWEIQSPSTFRDAFWLSDDPVSKVEGNTARLYLRWRLSRYLKTPGVDLQVQKSPFDLCTMFFRRQKPCWAEPGPTAGDLRSKLMEAIHQLHQANPVLAATIADHFRRGGDSYTPGLVEAATQGEMAYTHDKTLFPDLSADPTPEKIMAALPGEPTGNIPPAVEAVRERTERRK